MNILWVTVDRSNRVAKIFDPLREEVKKNVNVDVVVKKLTMLASAYQNSNIRIKEKNLVNPKKASRYDWVFTDAPFAFQSEEWEKVNTRKAVLFEDQHGPNPQFSRQFKNQGFDLFFTRYKNIVSRHSHLKGSQIAWLPHSIDEKIFKDYKLKKKIGALMVGRCMRRVYPIRHIIDMRLFGKPFYRKIRRPEETPNKKKKWPTGRNYARLLNSAEVVFTCSSIFKYPVLKFFEIPGCKSVLCADYNNEIEKLGFIPDKNMIEISKDTGSDDIEKLLKDKNKLEDISQKGYELIHSRHTVRKRAEEFLEHLENRS